MCFAGQVRAASKSSDSERRKPGVVVAFRALWDVGMQLHQHVRMTAHGFAGLAVATSSFGPFCIGKCRGRDSHANITLGLGVSRTTFGLQRSKIRIGLGARAVLVKSPFLSTSLCRDL